MNSAKTRINQALYAFHKDLAKYWTAVELATHAAYSVYHFQRLFKQVTGENVNDYLRRVRLEAAANLLLFSPHLSVIEVSQRCGLNSVSSFSQRFKSQFGLSPGQWRAQEGGEYLRLTAEKHNNQELWLKLQNAINHPIEVGLCQLEPVRVAYIRHTGYDRSITKAWHQLRYWCEDLGLIWEQRAMFGLFHSNPDIVPVPDCRYVACVAVPDWVYASNGVSVMTIPGGLHAKTHVQGIYGDFLPTHHQLLHGWLPTSGYEAKLTPAFVQYQKNQFLVEDESFALDFFLPVDPCCP